MNHTQKGFTLMELMIVVAVIGVLAAIALVMYQDYTARTRVSEVVLAASSCRTTITEVSQVGLPVTPTTDSFGCGEGGSASAPVSQYVESLSTDANGVITVVARNISQLDGTHNTLTLVPFTDPTAAAGTEAVSAGFVRDSEKAIVAWQCGGTGTTIPDRYLPASCR